MSTEQVDSQHEESGKKVAIKFLISNSHAGSLIGNKCFIFFYGVEDIFALRLKNIIFKVLAGNQLKN